MLTPSPAASALHRSCRPLSQLQRLQRRPCPGRNSKFSFVPPLVFLRHHLSLLTSSFSLFSACRSWRLCRRICPCSSCRRHRHVRKEEVQEALPHAPRCRDGPARRRPGGVRSHLKGSARSYPTLGNLRPCVPAFELGRSNSIPFYPPFPRTHGRLHSSSTDTRNPPFRRQKNTQPIIHKHHLSFTTNFRFPLKVLEPPGCSLESERDTTTFGCAFVILPCPVPCATLVQLPYTHSMIYLHPSLLICCLRTGEAEGEKREGGDGVWQLLRVDPPPPRPVHGRQLVP